MSIKHNLSCRGKVFYYYLRIIYLNITTIISCSTIHIYIYINEKRKSFYSKNESHRI